MSFTEYYVPFHQSGQQNQESQSYFLESYVSVYDSGQWVGDINILDAFQSRIVRRGVVPTCDHLEHDQAVGPPQQANATEQLISAESWHDILDPPPEKFIVRANGNWVARLATVAMLTQTLEKTDLGAITVYPRSVCWHCNSIMSERGWLPMIGGSRAFVY